MARQRDPRRDEALKIFIDRNGEVSNRELASFLDVPEKTISAWKSRDKWNEVLHKDNCSTSKNECSTTKRVGAPPGNQNAKGNKGNSRASPPAGNKNAVKTGEYETIFSEFLTNDERDLFQQETDPLFVLNEEIKLLRIRQRRMMQRLQKAEAGLDQTEQQILYELRGRKQIIETKGKSLKVSGPDELQVTERREKTYRKINDILAIEDALTRVSNQLTRTIKQQSELNLQSTKKALMEAQTDYTKAQTTKALINKDSDESDGGTVINIIDDIPPEVSDSGGDADG